MKAAIILVIALFCLTGIYAEDRNLQYATGYTYTNYGNDWTGTCNSGSLQSPVDLETSSGTCDSSMIFDISFSSLISMNISSSGLQTVRGIPASATSTTYPTTLFATDINGLLTGYYGVNFTFHAPAEHTIEGNTYDLEVQFLHKITTDFENKGLTNFKYAVVSILFSVSSGASDHPFLTSLVLSTPGTQALNLQSTLGSKLPSPIPYYTYQGSFTTPPCNEIVNWYVVSTPQTISSTQLAYFTNLWTTTSGFSGGKGNNRPIKSTNSRTIKKGGVECEEQFVYFFSFFILYIFINYFIFKLL